MTAARRYVGANCQHCGRFVRAGDVHASRDSDGNWDADPACGPGTPCYRRQREAQCNRWNEEHPVGSRVRCWPGARYGPAAQHVDTVTTGPARVVRGVTPVVDTQARIEPFPLTHVKVLEARDA